MDEPKQKRARVEREEWAKRVERWRDSGLTTAEFAAELGINPKTLTSSCPKTRSSQIKPLPDDSS